MSDYYTLSKSWIANAPVATASCIRLRYAFAKATAVKKDMADKSGILNLPSPAASNQQLFTRRLRQ